MDAVDAALSYLRAGLSVLPARLVDKRPALSVWKPFQSTLPGESEARVWFENAEALCIVTGAVSGNAEILDFDLQGELFLAWCERIRETDPTILDHMAVESSPSGGKHVIYRCESPVSGNLKLAQRKVFMDSAEFVVICGKRYVPRQEPDGRHSVLLTLIETRGEGGLFLCAPSPGYVLSQGDLTALPVLTAAQREALLEAAWSLNELIPEPEKTTFSSSSAAHRPGDDFNRRGDVRQWLIKHGWTLARPGENEYWRRPGKDRGYSATLKNGVFYVFSSNAAPFENDKAYAPFRVYALLEHGGNFCAAAAALSTAGYGGDDSDVDISALIAPVPVVCKPDPSDLGDPGPVPESLLRVPGFISELMDHCLETAPYPNLVMAFSGAVAMQAFLAGRKVRDAGDNRTNFYLLGLALSAAGKDWPRKLNTRIAYEAGMSGALGERFASGEGIQDALYATPSMLFQTDEIDGLLQSINKSKDARHENIMSTLLTMYSSANSIFPMRRRAVKDLDEDNETRVIDQPCLNVFGTAIPNHYYDALSERMLTNGLFARMLILESGPRSKGQDARICDLPQRVVEIAKWWAAYLPSVGNLAKFHPVPAIVQHDDAARGRLVETREEGDIEYTKAEQRGDPIGTTVWGRVNEQVRKLALLYAVSANHEQPHIDLAAAQWATEFVMHQTKRMLFMSQEHVADNPFHALCLKLIRKLRDAPGHEIAHSVLLKRMKIEAKAFNELVTTLAQRGDIEICTTPRSGAPHKTYRLRENSEGRSES